MGSIRNIKATGKAIGTLNKSLRCLKRVLVGTSMFTSPAAQTSRDLNSQLERASAIHQMHVPDDNSHRPISSDRGPAPPNNDLNAEFLCLLRDEDMEDSDFQAPFDKKVNGRHDPPFRYAVNNLAPMPRRARRGSGDSTKPADFFGKGRSKKLK